MARLSLLLATALTVAILAFPTKADALGPVDIEIGVRAGVAAGNLGPLGFGIGGRGGVSIHGLYAGIDVIDYLAATATCASCSMPAGAPVMQSRSALLYRFEAGYNLKVSRVTIRPQLGLGNFRMSAWYGDPTAGVISNYLYLEPGVVVLVSIGVLFVGADVGALLLPTAPDSALTVRPDRCHLLTGATYVRACARRKDQSLADFLRFAWPRPPTANRRAWRWPRAGGKSSAPQQ